MPIAIILKCSQTQRNFTMSFEGFEQCGTKMIFIRTAIIYWFMRNRVMSLFIQWNAIIIEYSV